MEDDNAELKRALKEAPVIQDQGQFVHATGDCYDGYFEAKKKDKTVKMHGRGVYSTAEGDTYCGTWDSDKLGVTDDVCITFKDGSKYEGMFKDWCYCGAGRYRYPDGSVLVPAGFVDSCPAGLLTLVDPNGHTWLGRAERAYCWFQPLNHYYELLESTRDDRTTRRRRRISQSTLSQTIK